MSLRLRGLALVLVALLMLAAVLPVSAQGGEGMAATVEGFLYVHALPDRDSYDYVRLDPDSTVTLIGRNSRSTWVKLVTEDGIVGWGRASAVQAEGDIASLPDVTPASTDGVVVNFAYLRESPSRDAPPVGERLEQGTVASVSARYYVPRLGDWFYATVDGAAGWLMDRGLAFLEGTPDVPEVNATLSGFAYGRAFPERDAYSYDRLNPGTPVTVTGRDESGDWLYAETLDGMKVWLMARAVNFSGDVEALAVSTPGEEQAVAVQEVALREGPSAEAAETGTALPQGTVVDLELVSGDWVYVRDAAGASGWVLAADFAYAGGELPAVLAANATVAPTENVETVNLRAAPSAEAPRRGWAAVGERLAVLGVSQDGQWYYVVPSSRVAAWVFAPLVELDPGAGPFPTLDAEGNVVVPAPEAETTG